MRNAVQRILFSSLLAIIAGCNGGGHDGPASTDSPASTGPLADARPDLKAAENTVVQLSGVGSSNQKSVSFAWTQISGPTVALSNTAIANPTFVMPTVPNGVKSAIELRLTVTDSTGSTASDTTHIAWASSAFVLYVGQDPATRMNGVFAYDPELNVQRLLGGPFSTIQYVGSPTAAPNGSRVVYPLVPDLVAGTAELYSVRPDGTGAVKLNSPLGGSGAQFVTWSPDSSRIAYAEVGPGSSDLMTVLPDGLGRMRLSDQVYAGSWLWTPDGSQLAFLRSDIASGRSELHVSKPDGSEHTTLTAAGKMRLSSASQAWSPDGRWLAYEETEELNGGFVLYTVRTAAQQSARIGPVNPGWSWSPKSAYFVFHYAGYLYAMRPDGTELVNLTKPVASREPFPYAWSPDGSKIAFKLNQDFQLDDLYTVRPDGQVLVRLNPTTGVVSFAWAPDGSRIVYLGPRTPGGPLEIFSVRPDSSSHTRLNRDLPSGGGVIDFRWAPDSSRILFLARQDNANLQELYSVRPDGTDLVKLNSTLFVPPGIQQAGVWSPDSSRIAYTIKADLYSTQMHTVRPDGSGRVAIDVGNVSLMSSRPWAADSSRILYWSDAGLRVALPDSPGGVAVDAFRTVTYPRWVP